MLNPLPKRLDVGSEQNATHPEAACLGSFFHLRKIVENTHAVENSAVARCVGGKMAITTVRMSQRSMNA